MKKRLVSGDKPFFFRASPLPHIYIYMCDRDLLATFSDQITPLRI